MFALTVKVIPRAAKTEAVGWMSDLSLKIRLAAPPVDGKANVELVSFLAKLLDTSVSDIQIISGHTSKKKLIRIPTSRETFQMTLQTKYGIKDPASQTSLF